MFGPIVTPVRQKRTAAAALRAKGFS
jgi:hypothetical protein